MRKTVFAFMFLAASSGVALADETDIGAAVQLPPDRSTATAPPEPAAPLDHTTTGSIGTKQPPVRHETASHPIRLRPDPVKGLLTIYE